MSGLILPGKGSAPRGEAKIELPGGFGSRKREEKPVDAPPTDGQPQSTPESTPPPAEQPQQRARRASDLLFPPTGAQVQCPNCGTPYVVPVFSILDLGANPELKGALLGGQINVAQCPNCGAGGPLSAPLMVHVPDRQFLGVIIPPEARLNDIQRQKVIGDMTQALKRKLPADAFKAYMFQPRQFLDWQRFMEQMWEFEGVTPEMLRRQRAQAELLQSLAGLGNDRKALEIVLQRSGELVDRSFFALLDRMLMMISAQSPNGDTDRLLQLRATLLEITPTGQQIAEQQNRIRAVLAKITPQTTREQLLDLLLDAWQQPDGREVVGAIILSAGGLIDYQFLVEVSGRIDKTTDPDLKTALEGIRQLALSFQEQQRQSQQALVQQAQQVLQEVLQSTNPADALRQYADYIDEVFLSLVAANAQNAERKNSMAAARRFRQIYDLAVEIMQEGMPAEVQLVNRLLSAPDKATLNALLEEHHDELTPELVAALRQMEDELRRTNRGELADQVKSLRGQIALKM